MVHIYAFHTCSLSGHFRASCYDVKWLQTFGPRLTSVTAVKTNPFLSPGNSSVIDVAGARQPGVIEESCPGTVVAPKGPNSLRHCK